MRDGDGRRDFALGGADAAAVQFGDPVRRSCIPGFKEGVYELTEIARCGAITRVIDSDHFKRNLVRFRREARGAGQNRLERGLAGGGNQGRPPVLPFIPRGKAGLPLGFRAIQHLAAMQP